MKRFTIFAAMLAVLLSSSTAIAQESYKVFDTSLFDGSISNDGGVVDFRLTMQIPAGQSFQASFGMSGFSLVPLEEKEIDVKLEIDGEEKRKPKLLSIPQLEFGGLTFTRLPSRKKTLEKVMAQKCWNWHSTKLRDLRK
jgi:hypothetical protein